MTFLSIFTPTYNRAHCLANLFDSLCAQTDRDFEWIIIDDGSIDDTEALVNRFKEKAPWMNIVYRYKHNGGKHTAHNMALPLIKGVYSAIVDSDDILVPNAVSVIRKQWSKYRMNDEVGQVIFMKGLSEDKPFCRVKRFDTPVDGIREKRISIKNCRPASADCFEIYRSCIFKKYPNPVFENEKFLGEGSFLYPINNEKKCVYINRVIYLCQYNEDGLTLAGRKMRLRNPIGGMYTSQLYMSPKINVIKRVKKAILYVCYAKIAGYDAKYIIKNSRYKLLTVCTIIPGYAVFAIWKRKYGLCEE